MSKHSALIKCQISDKAVEFHGPNNFKNANCNMWSGSHHVCNYRNIIILWLQYRELLMFGKLALFYPKFELSTTLKKACCATLHLIMVNPNVLPWTSDSYNVTITNSVWLKETENSCSQKTNFGEFFLTDTESHVNVTGHIV